MATKSSRFGAEIRRLRKSAKKGLRELAREIEISPTYLTLIEREGKIPSSRIVELLAKCLDGDVFRLFGLSGQVPQDVEDVVRRRPEMWALIRKAGRLTLKEIQTLTATADAIGREPPDPNYAKHPSRESDREFADTGPQATESEPRKKRPGVEESSATRKREAS